MLIAPAIQCITDPDGWQGCSVLQQRIKQMLWGTLHASYMQLSGTCSAACTDLCEPVSEGCRQVPLASIRGRIHGSQEAEVGVAGNGVDVPPLCNGHTAAAAFQQPCNTLQSLHIPSPHSRPAAVQSKTKQNTAVASVSDSQNAPASVQQTWDALHNCVSQAL